MIRLPPKLKFPIISKLLNMILPANGSAFRELCLVKGWMRRLKVQSSKRLKIIENSGPKLLRSNYRMLNMELRSITLLPRPKLLQIWPDSTEFAMDFGQKA